MNGKTIRKITNHPNFLLKSLVIFKFYKLATVRLLLEIVKCFYFLPKSQKLRLPVVT